MRNQNAKVLVARAASRQRGSVSWAQLRQLGVDRAAIGRWQKDGYLHQRLPGVYGVGRNSGGIEADLAAALLYAGPGAMLSHGTAAWWLGLLDEQPRVIHVSTPRRCRSQPGIKVHQRRHIKHIWHNGLPTTPLPQTFVDLAADAPLRTVRRALAKADYAGILDVRAIEAHLGPGRPGSVKLRQALIEHNPRLARTAQVRRDRRKEFALRKHGLTPLRYSDEQLLEHPGDVEGELRQLL